MLKVSYLTAIFNYKLIVKNHNMKVLKNSAKIEESCNSRNKNNLPLNGKRFGLKIRFSRQLQLKLHTLCQHYYFKHLVKISSQKTI